LSLDGHSVANSEFTVIDKPSQSEVEATSTAEVTSTSDGSQFELISLTETSETNENKLDASPDIDNLSNRPSSSELAPNVPSATRQLTVENLTWKTIEDVAGGSVQRYSNMMIDGMKANGVYFPDDAGVPVKGELIGDQPPNYENMNLGAKLWLWLTRKQRAVLNAQILKEMQQHWKEEYEAKNREKIPAKN
jgi:hypothetical protein